MGGNHDNGSRDSSSNNGANDGNSHNPNPNSSPNPSSNPDEAHVKVVLINLKAVKALEFAQNVLAKAARDQGWNTDFKRAARAIQYALNNIELRFADDDEP